MIKTRKLRDQVKLTDDCKYKGKVYVKGRFGYIEAISVADNTINYKVGPELASMKCYYGVSY